MRHADGSVDDTQIIVNFGDGADGGARRTRSGLLFDGDGRRKTLDDVDVGTFHLVEKLARVGGKRFDVAALALGINRVKSERRLTGSGEPSDDSEGVARDLDTDVLQIVLPCAPHDEFRQAHVARVLPPQEVWRPVGRLRPE